MPGCTVNWKIVFLLLLDEEPASASMTAFFHFQINAGPRGDDEACLAVTDVVRLPGWLRLCQGRGHGWQGWKPWGKDKKHISENIHLAHNVIVLSSVDCQEPFQDMKPHYIDRTYGETDHWYWVNRYFLLVLGLTKDNFVNSIYFPILDRKSAGKVWF